MSEDYRPMWEKLGLDLAAHDQLLGVLGQAYTDIFLSQKNRPEGMGYFDFVMSEVHGLRIKELMDAKAQGRKVFGSFCVYVPEEFALALDGVAVGLCAGAEFAFDAAETKLPANTCSLIKSFFGFTLARVCPYVAATDLIVGEATCDGKKKAYEIFDELVPALYVMDLPQKKSADGRALLRAEYKKLLERMESVAGKKATIEKLKAAIRTVNQKRSAMQRLARLRAADPAPISGLDALLANQVFFYDDPVRFTGSVNKICDELESRIQAGKGSATTGTTRILVAGCPMAVPNWKVYSLVENAGAAIVGEETCVGERGTQFLVEEGGSSMDDLLDAITDRYFKIDCAVFTPNPTRVEHIKQIAADVKADGVLLYNLQFCSPYQIECGPVEKSLREAGIPTLRVDTDYSGSDVGQLGTRIGAFLERLGK